MKAPRGPGGSPGTLRLILGDQLNPQHSWFRTVDPRASYLLMEVRQETDYVRHHIQKVLAFFQAMRAFRDQLQARGHRVLYLALDDPANRPSIPENLDRLLREFCAALSLPSHAVDSEHFLTTRAASPPAGAGTTTRRTAGG